MRHIQTITDPATGKVYPIPAGGADDGEPSGEGGGTSPGDANEEPPIDGDPDALGDPGKKALDSMKEQWKAERDRAAAAEKAAKEHAERLKELEATVAKFEGREKEYEAAQEAEQIKSEALKNANQRILKAEMRAAAKGVLSDPADALKFIDLSTFEVGDDGEVDTEALQQAINDLIESKPYLAVQDGRRFQGSADGGARNGSTKPSQLTRSDLSGMSPEQIVEAKDKGQLDELLGRS